MPAPAANLFIELRGKIDKLQQDMDGAVKTITGLEKRITSSFNTINKVANAALVIGGVVAVNKLKNALVSLADAGEVAGSIQENFQKLGGTTSQIDAASKAVQGMVDSFDLMKLANEGFTKNIKGFNENFSTMADLGGRLANALGTDTTEAIGQVIQAFSTAAPKQLAQIGIMIDAETAYKNYAKTLKVSVQDLTDFEKTQARQIEANKQLKESTEKLPPVTDSVSNAYKAFTVAFEEGYKTIAVQINSNQELQNTFRDLATELKDVPWEQIGRNISDVATIVTSNLGGAFSFAAEKLNNFLNGVKILSEYASNGFNLDAAIQKVQYLNDVDAKLAALNKQLNDGYAKFLNENGGVSPENNKPANTLDRINSEAKKAAEEVLKLKDKWTEFLGKQNEDNISKDLEKSIETLNKTKFDELKQNLSNAIQQGFVKEWEDAIKKGAVSAADVKAEAVKVADIQVGEWQTKFEEKSTEAYQNSIDTWRDLFQNAITGVTFNLEDALKQVAVGFAAQMAQAVIGSIGGIKISSPADIGGALFQNLLGDMFSGGGANSITGSLANSITGGSEGLLGAVGLGGGLGGLLGSAGMSGAAAQAAGISGPAMASGAFAEGSGLLGFAAANPYVAAALVAGGLAAGNWGSIEKMFGRGISHPQTLARRDFTGQLEDMFGAGGLQFFNEQGQAKKVTDFKFGKSRFNDSGWADKFNAKPNSGLFNQVGFALGSVFGNDKLPLEQVGAMLDESLGGSLEGLKALIQSTGVSTEEFTDKLMDAGKKGKGSWLEIIGAIHGVEEAMKPGLAATGDYTQAVDNLLKTGAKGQIALNQVKNIGIEAMEAHVKTFAELQAKLSESGKFTPEAISGLFNAINSQGLKSFDSLANASDRTLAEIVANMQAQGVKFEDSFKPLNDTIQQLNEMPDTIEKNVIFNVTSNIDGASQSIADLVPAAKGLAFFKGGKIAQFAKGGVVNGRTLFGHSGGVGMMGEAGAEGILPLTRVNGKLGVSAEGMGGGTVIHIDARGAQAGVEQKIRAVMREVEARAARSAYEGVMNSINRGGRLGSSF